MLDKDHLRSLHAMANAITDQLASPKIVGRCTISKTGCIADSNPNPCVKCKPYISAERLCDDLEKLLNGT